MQVHLGNTTDTSVLTKEQVLKKLRIVRMKLTMLKGAMKSYIDKTADFAQTGKFSSEDYNQVVSYNNRAKEVIENEFNPLLHNSEAINSEEGKSLYTQIKQLRDDIISLMNSAEKIDTKDADSIISSAPAIRVPDASSKTGYRTRYITPGVRQSALDDEPAVPGSGTPPPYDEGGNGLPGGGGGGGLPGGGLPGGDGDDLPETEKTFMEKYGLPLGIAAAGAFALTQLM